MVGVYLYTVARPSSENNNNNYNNNNNNNSDNNNISERNVNIKLARGLVRGDLASVWKSGQMNEPQK